MITEPTRPPRKRCSKCKDYKLLTEFHKEKKKPMGVQSRCIFCKQQENAEYQEGLRQEKLAKAERKKQKEIANGNGVKREQELKDGEGAGDSQAACEGAGASAGSQGGL